MTCPECGKPMGVTNTYSGDAAIAKIDQCSNKEFLKTIDPKNVIIRARLCNACKSYYWTIEVLDKKVPKNEKMRETLKKKNKK